MKISAFRKTRQKTEPLKMTRFLSWKTFEVLKTRLQKNCRNYRICLFIFLSKMEEEKSAKKKESPWIGRSRMRLAGNWRLRIVAFVARAQVTFRVQFFRTRTQIIFTLGRSLARSTHALTLVLEFLI